MFHAKAVNSSFHLCGCGYHHNRVDDISLAAATVVIVGPRVVHYFIGLVWLVTFVSLILC